MFDLTGKTALVTGASGGIGGAIAKALHAQGAKVVLSGTRAEALEALKVELGERAFTATANLSDIASVEALPKAAEQAAGAPIDILVNNAGITKDTTFKKMSKADWDAVIRTNLDSVFNMTKQVMDGMTDRGWGRVINVSSVNGSKGAFGQTNYSAAKAGMHGFTKALALEVARKGVTVNTISPGYIGTKMVTAIPKEVLDSKILPQIPLGRLGAPDEIAGLIIYLCSEEAAFVTGANIAINGGQHMQ